MGTSLLMLLAAALAPDGALRDSQDASKRVEYVLEVEGKSIPVAADAPFTIDLPDGKKLRAVLRLKPEIEYEGYGLSFRYPRGLRVTSESEEDGVAQIHVEDESSLLITLSRFSGDSAAHVSVEEFAVSALESFEDAGIDPEDFEKSRVKREIAGKEREGFRTRFRFAAQRLTFDTYGLIGQERSVIITFQHDDEDAARARKAFDLLCATLKFEDGRR